MPDEIAIKVEHVSKDFVLPHQRVNSVKGLFTNMAKKSHHKNKTKETQHALDNISFEIKKGEFFGIVGRNGSGKSTLLKILAGIYQPTEGTIQTQGKLVPFIELGVGFNPELTGRENVYLNGAMLGFARKEIYAMYEDIVTFAEIERFMDQKLKNYSSGMQVRLAFSMAIRAQADILLVDEVLAVGDADFQRKCFDYFKRLKRDKKTVVFVSHDMSAVREYCDRAIMIEKSQIIGEGTADKIASKYTRMFIEEAKSSVNKQEEDSKRWGTGAIQYSKVNVSVSAETITLKLVSKANLAVDNPNFGFSIRNASGQALMGTNSQIKKQKITALEEGAKAKITWKFANIFNDGDYYLDLAIVDTNGEVWDWWEDAFEFTVLKEERTPYPIHPDIVLILEEQGDE